MNLEKLRHLIDAHLEGKTIQYRVSPNSPWHDIMLDRIFSDGIKPHTVDRLRIKPERKVYWILEEDNGEFILTTSRPANPDFIKVVEVVDEGA